MGRVTVVCWLGEGAVPEPLQALIDAGEFDCPDCEPVMHIHPKDELTATLTEDGLTLIKEGYDLLVGHPDECPIAKAGLRRAAGAAGLN